ncbi:MAG: transcriptional regulator [Rhodopila sp.]|nr:transcriptional regulator [Rhodopila sp.]
MKSDTAVSALAALGHSLRLEVWRILVPYGPLGLPAGAISSQLAVPPSSLSFHLQQMTQGRVLVQRRSSRQIIYAVNNEIIDALCDFLANAGGQMIRLPPAALSARQSGDIIGER